MKIELPQINDDAWEKLEKSSFSVQEFLKTLELFDSIRHIAGASDFSNEVYANFHNLRQLAERVFKEGHRESASEMFFEISCIDDLMIDLEEWVEAIREALADLDMLRPENLSEVDGERRKNYRRKYGYTREQ